MEFVHESGFLNTQLLAFKCSKSTQVSFSIQGALERLVFHHGKKECVWGADENKSKIEMWRTNPVHSIGTFYDLGW